MSSCRVSAISQFSLLKWPSFPIIQGWSPRQRQGIREEFYKPQSQATEPNHWLHNHWHYHFLTNRLLWEGISLPLCHSCQNITIINSTTATNTITTPKINTPYVSQGDDESQASIQGTASWQVRKLTVWALFLTEKITTSPPYFTNAAERYSQIRIIKKGHRVECDVRDLLFKDTPCNHITKIQKH